MVTDKLCKIKPTRWTKLLDASDVVYCSWWEVIRFEEIINIEVAENCISFWGPLDKNCLSLFVEEQSLHSLVMMWPQTSGHTFGILPAPRECFHLATKEISKRFAVQAALVLGRTLIQYPPCMGCFLSWILTGHQVACSLGLVLESTLHSSSDLCS